MLGLQDWPTAPAGGSPLLCVLPLRGCKCSTGPLSVHEMSAVQPKETIRNSPSPRASGGREGLLFVSLGYLIAPPLAFSIVHVPSHMGSES